MRRHQNAVVETEVANRRLDLLVEGIDFLDYRLWHVGNLVLVEILKGFLKAAGNRARAVFRIKDDDPALDLALLEESGDQAGALVRRGRAAMRRRWQRHHQITALEVLNALLESKVFSVGNVGRREMRLGVFGSLAVVAEPGFVVVANAGTDDQIVVIDPALGGDDTFFVTLEGGDFGLDKFVIVFLCNFQVAEGQEVGVDDIDQPLVAHRAGEEDRVAFEHDNIQRRVQFFQVLGGADAAPASTTDNHPFARRFRQQRVGLHIDQER